MVSPPLPMTRPAFPAGIMISCTVPFCPLALSWNWPGGPPRPRETMSSSISFAFLGGGGGTGGCLGTHTGSLGWGRTHGDDPLLTARPPGIPSGRRCALATHRCLWGGEGTVGEGGMGGGGVPPPHPTMGEEGA